MDCVKIKEEPLDSVKFKEGSNERVEAFIFEPNEPSLNPIKLEKTDPSQKEFYEPSNKKIKLEIWDGIQEGDEYHSVIEGNSKMDSNIKKEEESFDYELNPNHPLEEPLNSDSKSFKSKIEFNDLEIQKKNMNFSSSECLKEIKGNYASVKEQHLLLELYEKHKDILENKSTEHNLLMKTKKIQSWKNIEQEYNAAGFGAIKTIPQLKRMWQHLRSKAKKESIQGKKEAMKTGGGLPSSLPSSQCSTNSRVLSVISNELVDLGNYFDSDNMLPHDDILNVSILEGTGIEYASVVHNEDDPDDPPIDNISDASRPPPTTSSTPARKRKASSYQNQLLEMAKEEHVAKMKIFEIQLTNAKLEQELLKKRLNLLRE